MGQNERCPIGGKMTVCRGEGNGSQGQSVWLTGCNHDQSGVPILPADKRAIGQGSSAMERYRLGTGNYPYPAAQGIGRLHPPAARRHDPGIAAAQTRTETAISIYLHMGT